MDFTRLTQGEKVAGLSGVALLLIMFIFKWFGIESSGIAVPDFGVVVGESEVTRNAWGSYGFFDIVLFIAAVAAVGLVLISASEGEVGLPVAASAVVAGLGILSVVLIVISIISPPNFADVDLPEGIDQTRKLGVWLGLLAAIGVAYGGWSAMQEEGTSFGDEADRFRAEPEAPGPGPESPPSSSPPPPPPPPGQAP
jgi:hypothetical protein